MSPLCVAKIDALWRTRNSIEGVALGHEEFVANFLFEVDKTPTGLRPWHLRALAEDQFVLFEGFRTLKVPRKERFHPPG